MIKYYMVCYYSIIVVKCIFQFVFDLMYQINIVFLIDDHF